METPRTGAKDPAIGTFLSLLMPGLGHLYAGSFVAFLVFLGLEIGLLSMDFILPLVVVHVFQAIAAGGAVKHWNLRNGLTDAAGVAIPPPPPARSGGAGTPPPRPPAPVAPPPDIPPPPPPSPPAVLDADGFLAELQAAWRDHRAGIDTARRFADRKWRAIRAVRVEHGDEGEALVAAARELSSAGVLTSEEIGQLAARIS